MSEDADSKDPGQAQERPQRTKLPERRTRTVLPEARPTPPGGGDRPAEALPPRAAAAGPERGGPGPKGISNLKRVLLVVGALVLIAGAVLLLAPAIAMMDRLGKPRSGPQEVDGGTLYWMTDGVVAVHVEEETGRKLYYVVEAPREANPQVTFNGSVMSLQVSTRRGLRTVAQGSDWQGAPKVLLYSYKDYYQDAVVLVGDTNSLDNYLAASASGASIAGFLPSFRRLELAIPATPVVPVPVPTPTPFPAPAPSPAPIQP